MQTPWAKPHPMQTPMDADPPRIRQQAGGTHPTGVHTCWFVNSFMIVFCEQMFLVVHSCFGQIILTAKETIHIISFEPINEIRTTKIYSLTQCCLTVNGCDWHILAGNDDRIKSHCFIRTSIFSKRTIYEPVRIECSSCRVISITGVIQFKVPTTLPITSSWI